MKKSDTITYRSNDITDMLIECVYTFPDFNLESWRKISNFLQWRLKRYRRKCSKNKGYCPKCEKDFDEDIQYLTGIVSGMKFWRKYEENITRQ